jgi:hypothetical protein
LDHLDYVAEANLIDNYRCIFYRELYQKHFHNVLGKIIEYIRSKRVLMKTFYSEYIVKKLSSKHRLLDDDCGETDIRLVCLHAKDKSNDHAVTVVGKFIFDSNGLHAMNFNKDSLDVCCNGSEFVGISNGYLFEKIKK